MPHTSAPGTTQGRPDRARSEIANVRYGSKADIQRYPLQCPLLGAKRTGAPRRQSNGAWSGSDRAAPERVRSIRPQEAPILIAELNAVDRLGYLAAGLNHNARQYHSDDSDCDGDLGRRRTALTLQESLQEANCPSHTESPAYRCHTTTRFLPYGRFDLPRRANRV